jgi:choline-sulfatase
MMPKNLILITVDEMRGDCMAANGDNPDILSPHMDALAARGVNLNRHFTTFPKCVPARISLTSGRYTHTDGYRNIFQHLPASQPDLLGALLQEGYRCALFGKNHCWENVFEATHTPPTLEPGQQGHRLHCHSWTDPYNDIYTEAINRCPPASTALDDHTRIRRKCDDEAFAEQAIHFLENDRDSAQPFYLHLNFNAPHPKYEVEEPWFSMYDRDQIQPFPYTLPLNAPDSLIRQREVRLGNDVKESVLREIQAVYYSMISKVDHLIGRVTKAISAQNLWKDSVVVFLSDHGDFAGQYGIWEKWDTTFSDCLTRVPAILVAEGLPAGKRFDQLSDHTDIAPTLCNLLGIPPLPGMQGQDLLPVIRGNAAPRKAVFANGGHEKESRNRVYDPFPDTEPENPHLRSDKQETYLRYPDTMARAKMVRTLDHKLVFRETGDHELYDMTLDPHELDNRFNDPDLRDIRETLLMTLLDWGLQTDTEFPRQQLVSA